MSGTYGTSLERDWTFHPFLAWLWTEARLIGDRAHIVGALGRRLLDAGVPIDRITTAVPILHPNIDTSSVVWQPDVAPVERLWQMTPENIPRRQNSPLQIVYRGGEPVRCRIGAEPEEGEFTILPDLRAEGITEYLVLPAPFSDGTTKAMTFTTRARRASRMSMWRCSGP